MVCAIQCINIAAKGQGLAAAIPAGTYSRDVVSPTDSVCNITFDVAGTTTGSTGVTPPPGNWKTGGGTGADYWVRWTNTSGTLTTGTAGSWLQLSSAQTFGKTRTTNAPGVDTVTGTVDIATDAAGANIIATGSITLQAECT